MYLGWYDDSRRPVEQKIAEAIDAYIDRFKMHPTIVLVNEADLVAVDGILVRGEDYIRRNNFWIGEE